jgi:hypothetical protein
MPMGMGGIDATIAKELSSGAAQWHRLRPSPKPFKPSPWTPPPKNIPSPRMPPPPSSATPAPAAAATLGAAAVAARAPGAGTVAAVALVVAAGALAAWENTRHPKPETAGMYPGSKGSILNGVAPFSGGQSPGVKYKVQVFAYYGYPNVTVSSVAVVNNVLGPISDITFFWADAGSGRQVGRLFVTGNNSGGSFYGVTLYTTAYTYEWWIVVSRVDGLPDTGGNPPAPTIQYSSPNISPGVSGTTGADGKPYIGTLSTTEGGKPSSSNTPSGIERKPRMSPPPLKDYDFPDPPPVPDPEEQYKNGTFPGGSKSSKGGSDTDGQYKPSPNLGDFGGDKTWFDTNGNVQKGGLKPHTNSSTNWTSVTPSPSGTHETTPKGDLEPNVTTPEKTYTPPPTTPKPTDTPDNTPDLTKFLPLIALAPSMDKKLDKIDDTVTQIKNEPKSPCLAPVYVPPVSAKVDTNISLTNTLQGVTIAQGETTRNAVNAVSNTVNTVNTKLGTQIVNGGIGGTLTRLYKVLHVDRVMNTMNTFLLVHNAVMLSRGIASTLTEVIDNSLDIAGFKFKNAEGEDAEISEVISGTLKSWIISIIGANNYTTTD